MEGTSVGAGGAATGLTLSILCHPHLDRVGERALLPASGLSLSRAEPAFAPPGAPPGEPLGDEHLSRKPIRLRATEDGGASLDTGESSTWVAVRGKRVQGRAHFSPAQVRRGVILELGHRVVLLLHAVTLTPIGGAPGKPSEIVGDSDAIQHILWEIHNVAGVDGTVLIRGETGSGKELVAQALHKASARREQPFVAVNLGAIPKDLAIAEMFGVERGAHTGADRRRPGHVEQARGGTLFLDEIGEAPIELQVGLLRFLETGEVQPVGGQIRKVDVRVIAATDADLDAKVAAGTFRIALLNRLCTYEIAIPPLRARRDDIGRLLVRFLREETDLVGEAHRLLPPSPEDKPWLPASLVARLADYEWPGNVRQLRNVVRQLVLASRGKDRLELTPVVERLIPGPAPSEPPVAPSPPSPVPDPPEAPVAPKEVSWRMPAEVTEDELLAVGRATGWNLSATAKRLRIKRPSLYTVMDRYDRPRSEQSVTTEELLGCYRECQGDLARMAERLNISEWRLAQRVGKLGLE